MIMKNFPTSSRNSKKYYKNVINVLFRMLINHYLTDIIYNGM